MNMKKISLTCLLALGLAQPALAAKEGVDYEVLPQVMPQLQKDKVEVLEFFGYFCIHCKNLDPILLPHTKKFASDTYFRTEHVVWDEARDLNLARLAAAVNESGLKYEANPAIFKAMFDDKIQLSDGTTAIKWISEQKSFDSQKLLNAYNSFNNQAQARKMADYTAEYKVESTPTLIVGGKYKVLFNNGFENGMKTIDELIQKVRDERKMTAPKAQTNAATTAPAAAQKIVKSKGAAFAKMAIY